jgi:hypothetical protein
VHAHIEALENSGLPETTTTTYRALARATAARHHKDMGEL